MTLQYRQLLFADLLATHLKDESKWVRMSAFQILGPFISTFAKQFTEVTYNQHGELVFTSQQDNRFRYQNLKEFYPYSVDYLETRVATFNFICLPFLLFFLYFVFCSLIRGHFIRLVKRTKVN